MTGRMPNTTYETEETDSRLSAAGVSDSGYMSENNVVDMTSELVKDLRIVSFSIIFGVIVTCNVLALYIIYKKKSNRRPSLKFTVGLCLENLIVGGVLIVFLIAANIDSNHYWLLKKDIWCTLLSIIFVTHLLATSWMALLISVDRYIAIKKSLRYTSWMTHRTCILLILLALLLALITALFQLTHWETVVYDENLSICLANLLSTPAHNAVIYNLIIINLAFPLPLLANCYIYWTIYLATKNTTALARRNSFQPPASPNSVTEESSKCEDDEDPVQTNILRRPSLRKLSGQLIVHKDNRKAAKMGSLVLVTQFFVFSPFYFIIFLQALSGIQSSYYWLAIACLLLDCVTNPIIYVLRNKSTSILIRSFCGNGNRAHLSKTIQTHNTVSPVLFQLVASQMSDDSVETKLFYNSEE
ncbi:hypothetical protein EB796_016011 [Bugula neritina]|uniref:G-protein coupled receptors family 1 profile domain-containing protein n=1 Tax=Bugula neritina TaxID=10212 RepID=A0A7J7JHL2_BUGNE|nr:hypothetical protein EB796_016011 [Bugula neritina]